MGRRSKTLICLSLLQNTIRISIAGRTSFERLSSVLLHPTYGDGDADKADDPEEWFFAGEEFADGTVEGAMKAGVIAYD